MECHPTTIPDVLLLRPEVHHDDRGWFLESYNGRRFAEMTGVQPNFVQDNHTRSHRGVLRGIHYQLHRPQGKLLRVTLGRVFDVVIDLRRSSPTFGRWCGMELSAEGHEQLWIPSGFGHGFLVLTDVAEVLYKVTEHRAPEHERSIRWNDPQLGIDWPLGDAPPILSARDRAAPPFADAELFA